MVTAMNSKFIEVLREIRFRKSAFPDAPDQLEAGLIDLENTIKENILSNSDTIKKYINSELKQISGIKGKIESYLKQFQDTYEKAGNYSETLEFDKEIEYHTSILYFIEDAECILNEYLKAYFPDKHKNPEKTFEQFLINNNKPVFAEKLKKEFEGAKGLNIRYMVEALINLGIIIINDRERMSLYNAMTNYFDWNIGRYQGIFDSKSLVEDNIKKAEQRISVLLNDPS